MQFRLAIFDFDGTLADTFPFFLSVFNRIADKHGFSRVDLAKVDSLRHYSTREMMRHVNMPAWKLPLASRSFMDLMKENVDGISLFDGIDDALRALARQGVQLAVVSSNAEHNVRKVLGDELAALFLRFDCGMSIFGKASRIRSVLKDTGVPAHSTIYIGDQGTDAEAARQAGVSFGAVRWGYATIESLRQHAPQAEFDNPAALAGIAAKFPLT